MGEIIVGITSWTEPTLIASRRFYPNWVRSNEARLQYYASQFPIVEVESTYYSLPDERTSGLWVQRSPEKFIFDVKAFRLFTQHPTSPEVLPPDIRERLPGELKGKKNLYYRELPPEITDELWLRFEKALLPLQRAGKLGVILFQFPPWYYPGQEHRGYIAYCQQKLPRYRLAVEFRHNSWVNEKNYNYIFNSLSQNNLIYVCVDEPQGFKSSVPPLARATSDISIVRFHGRNREAWEREGLATSARHNYLYTEDELREWVPRIRELAAKTQQVHVLFNNTYGDRAVVNARQTLLMLD